MDKRWFLQKMKTFNILTDALPGHVTLYENQYPVHTSFRNWLKISELLQDMAGKNIGKALSLCYKETLPPNLPSAVLGMMAFYNRGALSGAPQGEKQEPVISFSQDADVIFAAFRQVYGIDLTKEDLHWYVFCALFSALSEDNAFQNLIRLRTMDETTIKNPERRRKVQKLKEKVRLKTGKTSEIDVAKKLSGLF